MGIVFGSPEALAVLEADKAAEKKAVTGRVTTGLIGGGLILLPDGLAAGHFHGYSVIVDWRSKYLPKTPVIYAMPGHGEHWWGTDLRDAPTLKKEIDEMGGKPPEQSQKNWDSLNEAIRFAEFLAENPFNSLPPAEWVGKVTNFYLSLNNGLEEE